MEKNAAEILIDPKTIYWVAMPPEVLTQRDQIELLKRDILVRDVSFDELESMTRIEKEKSGFIFNLDRIIASDRQARIAEAIVAARRVKEFITKFGRGNSVVHTTDLDSEISDLFAAEKIPLLHKSLDYRKIALATLNSVSKLFFRSGSAAAKRSYLRLRLSRENRVNVKITNHTSGNEDIQGIIKDLSMNGLGITLKKKQDFDKFNLKDNISLKFGFEGQQISIKSAFVTRVYRAHDELGVNFNHSNREMIDEQNALKYSSTIYNQLREILNREV